MNPKRRTLIIGGILLGAVVLGLALWGAGRIAPGAAFQPSDSAAITTPGMSSDSTLTPPASASGAQPPVSSGTGESICFVTTKPPEPSGETGEGQLVLQCAPIEENKVDLNHVVTLGEIPRETMLGLEASSNGLWLAVTIATNGPIFTQVFETTTGQAANIEPKGGWYSRFWGWGADGNMAILSQQDQAILFNLIDQHEEAESLPSSTHYGVDLAPDGQHLVYALPGESSGSGKLYVKQRGAAEQPLSLTNPEAYLVNPRWSPTGDVIAYLRASDFSGGVGEIWVTNEALESPHKLSDLVAGYYGLAEYAPRWSPDGRSLAFVVWDNPQQVADDPEKRTSNIAVADSLSGEVRALTNFEDARTDWPSWSPDGRWIIFSRVENDISDLWMVEVATGKLQQVTSGINARHPVWVAHSAPVLPTPTPIPSRTPTTTPTITPTLAGTPTPTPTAALGLVTISQATTTDGKALTAYHFPTKAHFFASVLFDTEIFLAQAYSSHDYTLRLLSADLSDAEPETRVVAENFKYNSARLAAGIHYLIYAGEDQVGYNTGEWPLFSLNLDTRKTVPLGRTWGTDRITVFSVADNTGEVLMFENNHLVLKSADGTSSRTLEEVEAALGATWQAIDFSIHSGLPMDLSLSPDGQTVVIFDGQQIRALTINGRPLYDLPLNVDGDNATPIATQATVASWSPNGKQIAFKMYSMDPRDEQPYPSQVRVVELLTGATLFYLIPDQPETYRVLFQAVWSPDGKRFAFSTAQWVYIADASGALVTRLPAMGGDLAWSDNSSTVFYTCDQSGYKDVCSFVVVQ